MAKFKIGDNVKLIVPAYGDPRYGWGRANSGDEGVVVGTDGSEIFVDFPSHRNWSADRSELELVVSPIQPAIASDTPATKPNFVIGQSVRLTIPQGEYPVYGWGAVENGAEGVIRSADADNILVDFPKHKSWMAEAHELTPVLPAKPGEVEGGKRKLYAVCRDTGAIVCVEKTRQAARETKSALGGKEAGFSILQFKETKEVR